MNKIHLISYRHERDHPNPVGTHCGMHGYSEKNTKDEFTTANGDRFEAVSNDKFKEVSCKRCQKSAKRLGLTK